MMFLASYYGDLPDPHSFPTRRLFRSISAHVDMILINAVDPKAIEPAVKKAKAAGIVVVAVDVAAAGADATVQTNNVQARSEEHTSELQSQFHLVCRLLLDK